MATGAIKSYSFPPTLITSFAFNSKLKNSRSFSSLPTGGFSSFPNLRNAHSLKQQQAGGGAHRTRHCRLPLARASIDVKTTSSDSSSAMESSTIVPAVIVGYGRVGQALVEMGGGKDVVVKRAEPIPSDSQGPIIICTRNDVLGSIIDSTPPSRREEASSLRLASDVLAELSPVIVSIDVITLQYDRNGKITLKRTLESISQLVGEDWDTSLACRKTIRHIASDTQWLLQTGINTTILYNTNGMLEPFLESKGLADATQVLVYFAVAKAGDAPLDGKTDVNPEGLTAASGKWASAVATRLQSAGLSCKVLDPEEFKKPLLEKLIWISAFMLVGVRHPGATCGVVEKEHRDEVVSLIKELSAAAEAEKHIKFDAGLDERLLAYARSVAHYPTAVKEFDWRNGWFYRISQRAIASGQKDPLPLHSAWLKEAGLIKD